MKLPKNNHELKTIFKNAQTPDISELEGEYLVDMLTVFPSFKRFSHRKVFYAEDSGILGHNILFNRVWGRFFMEEGICSDLYSVKVAVINYDLPENSFFVKRVRDYVRCVEKNALYIGRFNYLCCGKLYYLGYFSLEKIK
jgi:hypothetical protein